MLFRSLSETAVLDFNGVQSLAEAKRLGKSIIHVQYSQTESIRLTNRLKLGVLDNCQKHGLLVYENRRPFWNCEKFLYSYPEAMGK